MIVLTTIIEGKQMKTRLQKNDAWVEGLTAGRSGKSRFSNPYLYKSPELAKEWDIGWQEGASNSA